MRATPLVLLLGLCACRMDNPAFEGGDELAEGRDTGSEFGDGDSAESGSSSATSNSGDGDGDGDTDPSSDSQTTLDSSSDAESSSTGDGDGDGESSSSSSSTGDGDGDGESSSSSDGESSSSSDDGMSSSSTDGLDAPDLVCPVAEPSVDCKTCLYNNCCVDDDLGCFDGMNVDCTCVLECLIAKDMECAANCDAGIEFEHATDIYDCGANTCANFC